MTSLHQSEAYSQKALLPDKNLSFTYEEAIELAIKEDLGSQSLQDLTTDSIVAPEIRCRAHILQKEAGVLAGTGVARDVFKRFSEEITSKILVKDGTFTEAQEPGEALQVEVMLIDGPAKEILKAERLVLNLMQRMSGVATITREFVAKAGPVVKVLDTRKTTPCLRALDRLAVKAAGGTNHRSGLYDQVLIKDNHISIAGSVTRAVELVREKLREKQGGVIIEVETRTMEEVEEAASLEPDIIMLDNMTPSMVKEAVKKIKGRSRVEISGGINLDTISSYLIEGVDAISVGALTHSAPSVDLSLNIYQTD